MPPIRRLLIVACLLALTGCGSGSGNLGETSRKVLPFLYSFSPEGSIVNGPDSTLYVLTSTLSGPVTRQYGDGGKTLLQSNIEFRDDAGAVATLVTSSPTRLYAVSKRSDVPGGLTFPIISVFDLNRHLLFSFKPVQEGMGELIVGSMTATSSGDLYVVNEFATDNAICHFGPDGKFIGAFSGEWPGYYKSGSGPVIAADEKGDLYVAGADNRDNPGSHTAETIPPQKAVVRVYSSTGALKREILTGRPCWIQLKGIVVDKDGSFYLSGIDDVYGIDKFNANGILQGIIEQQHASGPLAIDTTGKLYAEMETVTSNPTNVSVYSTTPVVR